MPGEVAHLHFRRRMLEAHIGVPFTEGNLVRPLHNGVEIFPAMLGAIRQAKHFVHLLTYIWWSGDVTERFVEALAERAEAGVAVRVLLDAVGSAKIPSEQENRMRAAGVQVVWFRRPFRGVRALTHRTHRKILVCDGQVAFTGGVGIAAEWDGDARNPDEWRDIQFEFRGPAVDCLNGSFWENWAEPCPEAAPVRLPEPPPPARGSSHVQVVSSSSGSHGYTINTLLHAVIALAERRLDLVTPYLVLNRPVLNAIIERARAGVAVRLLLPGPHLDIPFARWTTEGHFRPLLRAGVRIFLYQPTMMHTKVLLVDDDLVLGGSINLNQRSLKQDEETAVLMQDPQLVAQLDAVLHQDFLHCHEVPLEKWRHPSILRRSLRTLLRPFRSHL